MIKRRIALAILMSGALAVAAPLVVSGPGPATAAAPVAVLPSFAPLVRATQSAVVTVRTAGHRAGRIDLLPMNPRTRNFLERYFGRDPFGARPHRRQRNERRRGARPRPSGLGSGFIIESSGIIVTNNHVIDGAEEITIVLTDGSEFEAQLVGRDTKTDLAVLRIDAGRDLPTVPWGDSDAVEVGDWAVAIGNPFGLGSSVTAGIVSARGRDINSGPYDDFFQVDAPINRGNSGGPLFDQLGNVIGVNTAIFSPSGGNVGIGFAIPSNLARRIVADLVDDGRIERGWLGVTIQPVTGEIAESMGLEAAAGALIADLAPDGPAKRAGLRRGDVIIGFDAADIDTVKDLTRAVAATAPGTQSRVRIWRRGSYRDLTVRTGKYPT